MKLRTAVMAALLTGAIPALGTTAAIAATTAPSQSEHGIQWYQGDIDAAFARAKAENKPLFLYWAPHAPHLPSTPLKQDQGSLQDELNPWMPVDERDVRQEPESNKDVWRNRQRGDQQRARIAQSGVGASDQSNRQESEQQVEGPVVQPVQPELGTGLCVQRIERRPHEQVQGEQRGELVKGTGETIRRQAPQQE